MSGGAAAGKAGPTLPGVDEKTVNYQPVVLCSISFLRSAEPIQTFSLVVRSISSNAAW